MSGLHMHWHTPGVLKGTHTNYSTKLLEKIPKQYSLSLKLEKKINSTQSKLIKWGNKDQNQLKVENKTKQKNVIEKSGSLKQ